MTYVLIWKWNSIWILQIMENRDVIKSAPLIVMDGNVPVPSMSCILELAQLNNIPGEFQYYFYYRPQYRRTLVSKDWNESILWLHYYHRMIIFFQYQKFVHFPSIEEKSYKLKTFSEYLWSYVDCIYFMITLPIVLLHLCI